MNNWHSIWEKRNTIDSIQGKTYFEIIESLLAIDGFDSGTGKIEPNAWLNFIKQLNTKIGLTQKDSVFEVGCGSGAFLFPYFKAGHKIGGLDFSNTLIENCYNLFGIKEGFVCASALELDTTEQFDFVISFSVFFYFPDEQYASSVLEKMLHKAKKGVVILDVPDIFTKEICEVVRRGTMPQDEYEKKYFGLNHLYYNKDFFIKKFAELGVSNVNIEQQKIEKYINNEFRFNCIAIK